MKERLCKLEELCAFHRGELPVAVIDGQFHSVKLSAESLGKAPTDDGSPGGEHGGVDPMCDFARLDYGGGEPRDGHFV